MAELVEFFFSLQANIKLYHWMTTSFARHKASDELVDSILEHSDKFMEVYIGKYGRDGIKQRAPVVKVGQLDDRSIVKCIDDAIKYLTNDVGRLLKKQDVDLFNIRDELVASLNKTKYLFTLN